VTDEREGLGTFQHLGDRHGCELIALLR